MKKAAMNRKKRLDAPSKQELRERYESVRRQNAKEDEKEDLSSTTELPKRAREDSDQSNQAESSDLRDKIPKLSRTIAGNDDTGSLVVNVGKTNPKSLSLVDPSYDDSKMSVETFDYSHKRSDTDPTGDDEDDLRSLIERQRKSDISSKKDDKHSKKSGSTFFDSKTGYNKEDHSKTKSSDNYRDSKRKESKDSKSSSGKSDRYAKQDTKSKSKKGKGESLSSYELGLAFFSGSSGTKNVKSKDKPAEDMDINETLKELAYLRSIQTGDNALPKEEEEYFRKMNDLSKPILASQFDLLVTETDQGKNKKADGGKKTLGENLSKIESKWDNVIDNMLGTKRVGNTDNDDDATYGPSLPPKKSSVTPKKAQDSSSPEWKYSKERSSSISKADPPPSISVRGMRGGRGFRGRGIRGSFRGRGRGRGRGDSDFALGIRGRGRARSRGRFIRGGFIPSRGRHIFNKEGTGRRRSRSRSSSRSTSSSRSRSRSRGRSSTKRRRRRSSSRSSYSSSSYSRSRSHSRDKGKGRRQTRKRSRSRSYSSRSRSRSRSRSYSRSSRSRKRSRSPSKSGGSYKKPIKDRARSRSKSSSRSRSRKRKERSRSWSFDEDYTKNNSAKSTLNSSGTKSTDSKAKSKKEQDTKLQSKPKKEKTETPKSKNDKVREPKKEQSVPGKGKTQGKIPENVTKTASDEKQKSENSHSPAVVALKDLKVTAFSNVFLPRTVTKTTGNVSKGMPIGKGRYQPLKKHPVFDTQEDDLEEEEKIDPKELERMKEEKHKFDKEIDKVFNAKPEAAKRGTWKRVWPEETPKEKTQQELKELEEIQSKEPDVKNIVEDQRIVEAKDTTEEKKTEKEQKKEKKEKRKKEKEEKSKRKKEKKEKKEKKNKESNQENLGNENKEKGLVDDSQTSVDSSQPEQYQEGYSGYAEEYPEGEYQYYDETGQEQGWYDEDGVYHPYEEEEYLYYYDQEGNIVGYEGPEGYVEGNPFEEQQYYYEGEPQGGVQPEEYEHEAYPTEYSGDAEGSYQYSATDYPVEGQVGQGQQYNTVADSQWEQYPADAAPEQQWYGAEGTYHDGGQGYTEYQYAEGAAVEQQHPGQQDPNYMVQQGDSLVEREPTTPQTYVAPVQATEEPKTEGDISESDIVLALGKNLAALARLKGWNQQELLDKDPINLVQMLQKPPAEKPETAEMTRPEEPISQFQQEEPIEHFPPERNSELPRQQPLERKIDEARMHHRQERNPSITEQKPLKSILKKGSSSSLKPPPKTETSVSKSDPSNDHVGPEYIVRISKSGPERFFCKLCQCHIESPMAKELHVKSMKHIELFVREKSSLLHSVIGTKSEESAVPESSAGSGFSEQGKLEENRETREPGGNEGNYQDNPEDDPSTSRLLDYDRLRLRDWHRREVSVGTTESDNTKQFEYGRTEEDYESRTSSSVQRGNVEEDSKYEDRNEHLRWPRGERPEADWRHDEQGYGRERRHHAPENRERAYEKGDYQRERRSLSHESDRRDDRGSIGSRSSERSIEGSDKDSRSDKPMTYRSRLQQDIRSSTTDRPGLNKVEVPNSRERTRGGVHREQSSRHEQVPGRDRSDISRQKLDQNERGRSSGDTSGQGRGRTSLPPQDSRGQAQDRWHGHGQAGKQDKTRQDPGKKVQETSSHSTGSSRMPSSESKEIPAGESASFGRGRLADQSAKPSERISQSIPVVQRNQGQPNQKTSKDNVSSRSTSTGLVDSRELSQKAMERHPGRGGMKPLKTKPAQEGRRRSQESQQQAQGSTNVRPPSAALLGDAPGSQTQDQKPQEQVKNISTVQGQRRVPPPPPPYNKGSGPQSFRGRGRPPAPGGRGAHPHIPPNQPGMMSTAAPPHSLLPMPPQGMPHDVGAPSSAVPPRNHFAGDPTMGDHLTPPPYYGRGRGRAAGQPQYRGRGGGPHPSRGGYAGPPQFASRGRGGRGYHSQQWL